MTLARLGVVRVLKRGAAATLPEAAFRRQPMQDHPFPIRFAQADVAAVRRSRTLHALRAAQRTLAAITNAELDLHVRHRRAGSVVGQPRCSAEEHLATVADKRFVRGCGAASDYLDPRVTLSPCVIAYAEIGVWRATPVCLPEPGRLVRRAMRLEADVRMAALTD